MFITGVRFLHVSAGQRLRCENWWWSEGGAGRETSQKQRWPVSAVRAQRAGQECAVAVTAGCRLCPPWLGMALSGVGKQSAHLAMIDTLMMAYTVEMISVEKVVACAQQYSAFFQATDLPYDIEDAVMYWVNKARYRREQTLLKQLPCIPLVENLLKDGTDGCALAALIHFYCPGVVRLEDICLKETMSLADSLYNLQLIQEFCQEYLNQCCHFTLEDMLYAASSIKSNYLVFMAELFWWFEVVKPSFVQPRDARAQGVGRAAPFLHLPSSRAFCSEVDVSAIFLEEPLCNPLISTWESRDLGRDTGWGSASTREITADSGGGGRTCRGSNEGLTLNNNRVSRNVRKNLSFKPVNGEEEAEGLEEELNAGSHGDLTACLPLSTDELNSDENLHYKLPNGALQNRVLLDEFGNQIGTPSIEEALQIIHDTEKTPCPPQTDHIANGFFLHSQDTSILRSGSPLGRPSPESTTDGKGALSPVTDNTEVDTGIHVPSEDIPETMDEDSSLRDYTVSLDSDMDDASKFPPDYDVRGGQPRDAPSPCPSTVSTRSQPGSSASSSSGVKMTSFAEQKFRKLHHADGKSSGGSSQKTTPEGSELNIPHVVAWAQIPEEAGLAQGRDTTQLLASEMLHLRMKLEEKRRAIEAQKKKMEAAFTKQRQKMGRTAFLTVVKKKGDGASPLREEAAGAEDEKVFTDRAKEKGPPRAHGQRSKSLADIKEGAENPQGGWLKSPAAPGDPEKQWGLASPSEDTLNEGELLEYSRSIERLNSSLHFLQQEMQRLSLQQELLMQMREQQAWVISPPQPSPQKQPRDCRPPRQAGTPFSADAPRPGHPSPQSNTRKTASFSAKNQRTPRPNELKITPLNRTLTAPRSVDSLPRLRRFSPSQVPIQTRSFVCLGDDGEPQAQEPRQKEEGRKEEPRSAGCGHGAEGGESQPLPLAAPEGPMQPVPEPAGPSPDGDPPTQPAEPPSKPVFPPAAPKNVSLIEVSLSDLKPPEKADVSVEKYDGESDKEQFDDDQKVCCGFFFKDDQKAENDMAMKRAALLEKRLRREKETQLRKQQLEAELEHKKEETRRRTEEERQRKEDERARREFIRQEHLRRKQLKLMEDMDTVLKARPQPARPKKQRPKSIHRDHVESPRTPVKGPPAGVAARSPSAEDPLARGAVPHPESLWSAEPSCSVTEGSESVEGFLSPGRCGSRNGEKDWENASTTSSVASGAEYTGQLTVSVAAMSLELRVSEMEKSDANNFLILFRDSGCQFRSLYTYCPETEDISKLTGIGPRAITKKMIEGLYKYNSDRKQFSHIPAKTLSASVDAITIHSHLWQTRRPVTPKKLLPTKA
ncbi:calmodulin-regulated spectrin-associated protein 2 [Camelus ferus]|nr:calmodulin-regulated spectrin-associated protein 2 [Camelus ferus]